MSAITIGSIWKERDSRFIRYVMVVGIQSDGKAIVRSSTYPHRGYGTRKTRIRLNNFVKRYSFFGEVER